MGSSHMRPYRARCASRTATATVGRSRISGFLDKEGGRTSGSPSFALQCQVLLVKMSVRLDVSEVAQEKSSQLTCAKNGWNDVPTAVKPS
jgi:hypothetical protein